MSYCVKCGACLFDEWVTVDGADVCSDCAEATILQLKADNSTLVGERDKAKQRLADLERSGIAHELRWLRINNNELIHERDELRLRVAALTKERDEAIRRARHYEDLAITTRDE